MEHNLNSNLLSSVMDWSNDEDDKIPHIDLVLEEDKYKKEKFEDMNLKKNLLRGIYNHGFDTPSLIQQKAICALINEQNNIIIQSQSGTGKSGVFLISALQLIDEDIRYPQVLIITPTRELAIQHYKNILSLSEFMNVKTLLVIGEDKTEFTNAHCVIGTLGKLIYAMTTNKINFNSLKLCILDEADNLMNNNFNNQMSVVYSKIKTKYCLFSATYTLSDQEFIKKQFGNTFNILLNTSQINLQAIKQYRISLNNELDKLNCLKYLLKDYLSNKKVIVFFNTNKKINGVKEDLINVNIDSVEINSNLTQIERNNILERFRNNKIKFLLSSDLLNRGIDIQGLEVIINYDIPNNYEAYIHRIGRCGRFYKSGIVYNLISSNEALTTLQKISEFYNINIEELK